MSGEKITEIRLIESGLRKNDPITILAGVERLKVGGLNRKEVEEVVFRTINRLVEDEGLELGRNIS